MTTCPLQITSEFSLEVVFRFKTSSADRTYPRLLALKQSSADDAHVAMLRYPNGNLVFEIKQNDPSECVCCKMLLFTSVLCCCC